MTEQETRLYVARLEGAAKRLLDALGMPVDNRDGADCVINGLTSAAEKLASSKPWEF